VLGVFGVCWVCLGWGVVIGYFLINLERTVIKVE